MDIEFYHTIITLNSSNLRSVQETFKKLDIKHRVVIRYEFNYETNLREAYILANDELVITSELISKNILNTFSTSEMSDFYKSELVNVIVEEIVEIIEHEYSKGNVIPGRFRKYFMQNGN